MSGLVERRVASIYSFKGSFFLGLVVLSGLGGQCVAVSFWYGWHGVGRLVVVTLGARVSVQLGRPYVRRNTRGTCTGCVLVHT